MKLTLIILSLSVITVLVTETNGNNFHYQNIYVGFLKFLLQLLEMVVHGLDVLGLDQFVRLAQLVEAVDPSYMTPNDVRNGSSTRKRIFVVT